MRRPVRFCSRMCADHPAVRAQVNIGVNIERRHLGEVEDDGGPELDVRGEHPVGPARVQLLERGLLEGGRGLVARGAEALAGRAQHAGARVLGAVDAVAEAHQAVALVEDALDVGRRVALLLDAVEHVEHAGGRAAVERPGHGADGPREGCGDVGAGGGDDAGREGRGIHAVLGGGDPVGVDGLDVLWVGLAAPADHEALGDRAGLVDLALRDHRLVEARGPTARRTTAP